MPGPTYCFDVRTKAISTRGVTGGPTIAAFVDGSTDSIFVAKATSVFAYDVGPKETTIWRTREYVFNRYPSFGWVRINATFETGVIVRVYRDGVLSYTTPAIMTKDPVRLPAGKSKSWWFEIESADFITSFVVATTSAELV